MPSHRRTHIEPRLRLLDRLILLAHAQATEEDEGVEEVPIINIRDTCENPDLVNYELWYLCVSVCLSVFIMKWNPIEDIDSRNIFFPFGMTKTSRPSGSSRFLFFAFFCTKPYPIFFLSWKCILTNKPKEKQIAALQSSSVCSMSGWRIEGREVLIGRERHLSRRCLRIICIYSCNFKWKERIIVNTINPCFTSLTHVAVHR